MLAKLTRSAANLLKYRRAGMAYEVQFRELLEDACDRTSAKTMAEAIGISAQHLCDVRKGRRAVTDRVLTAIAGSKR